MARSLRRYPLRVVLRLLRYSPRLQLGFARDVVDADGRHHPIVERVSRADDPIHLRL